MKIFKFNAGLEQASFWLDESSDGRMDEWARSFDRSYAHEPSLVAVWPEVSGELKSYREPGEKPWPAKDIARINYATLAIRQEALDRTDSLWGLVEMLPLDCRDGDYSAFHVNRHHDAFDMDASTTGRRKEWKLKSGALSPVIVYEMDTAGILEVDIFRVPELTFRFCTEGFVEALRDAGVDGWRVQQVYPPTPKQLSEEDRLFKMKEAGDEDMPFRFGDRSLRKTLA